MSTVLGEIYCLFELGNDQTRYYIGQTRWSMEQRLWGHIYDARHTSLGDFKNNWVRRIIRDNGTVSAILLDLVPVEELDATECAWIDTFKALGFDLVNLRGGGSRGKMPERTKQILSEFHKTRYRPPSEGMNISRALRGKPKPIHWRESRATLLMSRYSKAELLELARNAGLTND